MFDAKLRPLIDPPLNALGRAIARTGLSADAVTLFGAAVGVGAGYAISQRQFWAGLGLIALSRLFDGLDGAVARATRKTDFGGFLDIVADFIFYVSVPIGFGLADPHYLVPALFLIASFAVTGISFMAFATMAAKRGLETTAHGEKNFFYNTGLAEGTETITAFALMCLFPGAFSAIAWVFFAACVVTVLQRTLAAKRRFGDEV